MMQLERQRAKLDNVNLRAEKEGTDNIPAADLKFTFDAPNDLLSEFHPSLKSSLFRKAEAGDQPDLLDGLAGNGAGWLPKLRFPKMSAFRWDFEIAGGSLTLHIGTSERSDIQIDVRSADKFEFEPKDGGTVSVSFRVQCRPDERQIGKLYKLIQASVELTLTPPEPEPELVGSGG